MGDFPLNQIATMQLASYTLGLIYLLPMLGLALVLDVLEAVRHGQLAQRAVAIHSHGSNLSYEDVQAAWCYKWQRATTSFAFSGST